MATAAAPPSPPARNSRAVGPQEAATIIDVLRLAWTCVVNPRCAVPFEGLVAGDRLGSARDQTGARLPGCASSIVNAHAPTQGFARSAAHPTARHPVRSSRFPVRSSIYSCALRSPRRVAAVVGQPRRGPRRRTCSVSGHVDRPMVRPGQRAVRGRSRRSSLRRKKSAPGASQAGRACVARFSFSNFAIIGWQSPFAVSSHLAESQDCACPGSVPSRRYLRGGAGSDAAD